MLSLFLSLFAHHQRLHTFSLCGITGSMTHHALYMAVVFLGGRVEVFHLPTVPTCMLSANQLQLCAAHGMFVYQLAKGCR